MKQNMRHSCTCFAWQFPSASSDYLCIKIPYWSFSNLGLLEVMYHLESLYKNCTILQSKIQNHSTTDMEATATVREVLMIEEDRRIPFIDFIKEFKVPPGFEAKSIQAALIIRRSKGFVLVGDNLYKRSASGILMKCHF